VRAVEEKLIFVSVFSHLPNAATRIEMISNLKLNKNPKSGEGRLRNGFSHLKITVYYSIFEVGLVCLFFSKFECRCATRFP
jgi:hypothetical protein